MVWKEIYIIIVCIELGINGKGGYGEGEREEKFEKLDVLYFRYRKIFFVNSILVRFISYVYDKVENKRVD